MADTVITTPARDYDSGASAVGWAIATILLFGIVLFGILVWPGLGRVVPASPANNTDRSIDLNVKIPEGAIPGTNNSGQGTQGGGTNNPGTQQQPATQ